MMPESKGKFEKKKISIISVSGGMIWTIASTLLGAYLGTAGTLYGAAIGTGMGSVWAVGWENFAMKQVAKVKARKGQERDEERHPRLEDRGLLMQRVLGREGGREALIAARQRRIMLRERNPWKAAFFAALAAAACFLVTVGTVLGVEAATGRTLHSDLTGARQYGTSFSYSTSPSRSQPVITPPAPASASLPGSPAYSPSVPVPASSAADASPSASTVSSVTIAPAGSGPPVTPSEEGSP